jgi:hypothetical protein
MLNMYFDWLVKHKITNTEIIKGEFIQRFFKWFAEVVKEVDQPGVGALGVANIIYNDPIELGVLKNEPKKRIKNKEF